MSSPQQEATISDVESAAQGKGNAWNLTASARGGIYSLYVLAAYFFVRAHSLTTVPYLKMGAYLAGTERLPFQRRVLPMLLLRALLKIPLPHSLSQGAKGVLAHPELTWLFLIDLVAFAVTAYLCVRLYYEAARRPRFGLLVFPLLLFAASWTYLIHTEQDLYYPYDMMSAAFFTAGLYFIYTRNYLPLLAVMLVGTLNRDTTVFLLPLFALDAGYGVELTKWKTWISVPWGRTILLTLMWVSIKVVLSRYFVHNDRSEDYFRLKENLLHLSPKDWPELLGGCGFLLPVTWFCRRRIENPRVRRWVLIVPLWVVGAFCFGVLRETRIYGELCSLVALSSALLLDSYCSWAGRLDGARAENEVEGSETLAA